jgi:transmembrane sensor
LKWLGSPSPVKPGAKRAPALGAITVLFAAVALFFAFDDLMIRFRADFSTETAGTKTITLEDGSRIQLNAESAIAANAAA